MFFIKIRSNTEGAHVRARFFMARSTSTDGVGTFASLGELIFLEDEFGPFCEALYFGAGLQDDMSLEIEARGEAEQSQLEKVSIQMASAKEQIEQLNTDVADERSRILGLFNQLAEAKGEEDD